MLVVNNEPHSHLGAFGYQPAGNQWYLGATAPGYTVSWSRLGWVLQPEAPSLPQAQQGCWKVGG